jgi:hypothetical protein
MQVHHVPSLHSLIDRVKHYQTLYGLVKTNLDGRYGVSIQQPVNLTVGDLMTLEDDQYSPLHN